MTLMASACWATRAAAAWNWPAFRPSSINTHAAPAGSSRRAANHHAQQSHRRTRRRDCRNRRFLERCAAQRLVSRIERAGGSGRRRHRQGSGTRAAPAGAAAATGDTTLHRMRAGLRGLGLNVEDSPSAIVSFVLDLGRAHAACPASACRGRHCHRLYPRLCRRRPGWYAANRRFCHAHAADDRPAGRVRSASRALNRRVLDAAMHASRPYESCIMSRFCVAVGLPPAVACCAARFRSPVRTDADDPVDYQPLKDRSPRRSTANLRRPDHARLFRGLDRRRPGRARRRLWHWPIGSQAAPATADTIYRAGSISKLFNAIAVDATGRARQARSRRADPEGAARSSRSSFRLPMPTPITLAAIALASLGHDSRSAGRRLSRSHASPRSKPRWPASPAPCSSIRRTPKLRYSNVGPTIAGQAVVVQSGLPYPEYQQKHVLESAGHDQLGLDDERQAAPAAGQGTHADRPRRRRVLLRRRSRIRARHASRPAICTPRPTTWRASRSSCSAATPRPS